MLDKNRIEYFLFILFAKFFDLLGSRISRICGKAIGILFFYFIPIRKKVVIGNLSTAFPELSKKELYKLARRNYILFGVVLVEIMGLMTISREELIEITEIENLDIIEKRKNERNGLILLTAHIGNWELGAIITSIYLNEPIYALVKEQRNPYVTNWMNVMRSRFGNKIITLGVSVKELFAALKQGNVVGIVGDQRAAKESVRVQYFNQPTAVYTGAASIANKLKVPVISVFGIRMPNNKFKIFTKEIDYSQFQGTGEEIAKQITQEYMKLLENKVREYPDQWLWMHKIWKY